MNIMIIYSHLWKFACSQIGWINIYFSKNMLDYILIFCGRFYRPASSSSSSSLSSLSSLSLSLSLSLSSSSSSSSSSSLSSLSLSLSSSSSSSSSSLFYHPGISYGIQGLRKKFLEIFHSGRPPPTSLWMVSERRRGGGNWNIPKGISMDFVQRTQVPRSMWNDSKPSVIFSWGEAWSVVNSMKYEHVPAPALKIPNLESGNCISGSLYGFSRAGRLEVW